MKSLRIENEIGVIIRQQKRVYETSEFKFSIADKFQKSFESFCKPGSFI